MATFLDTNAINFYLDQILKEARQQIVIISPYLKFNDRVRERLADQDRLKVDMRIVYGKSELQPQEIGWLQSLSFVRTSFCKNLHAKCYLNEAMAIVTSMNLYEFSQVNNNEMGILVRKAEEPGLYNDVYSEAQRLVRISEEIRLSAVKVVRKEDPTKDKSGIEASRTAEEDDDGENGKKVTTSRLGRKHGLKTNKVLERLVELGYLVQKGGDHALTSAGVAAGGERRVSTRFGPFFLWPDDTSLS